MIFVGSKTTSKFERLGIKSTIPLGRLAEPHDVSNACMFLCSEESDFITGVMLEVDGGRTI